MGIGRWQEPSPPYPVPDGLILIPKPRSSSGEPAESSQSPNLTLPGGYKSLPPNPLRPPLTQQLELGQPAKPWGSQGQAAARWAIQSQSRQERRRAWQAASPREAARAEKKDGRRGERKEQAETVTGKDDTRWLGSARAQRGPEGGRGGDRGRQQPGQTYEAQGELGWGRWAQGQYRGRPPQGWA